jgi:DNA-binding transcriptional LysR family regulator
VRDILARLERARAEARRRSAGKLGRLRLGLAGATYLAPVVTQTILTYRTRLPGATLSPEQSNTPALMEGLLSGRLDAAFIRPPLLSGRALERAAHGRGGHGGGAAAGHPLAGREAVDLGDMGRETIILFPCAIGPGLHDAVVTALREAGVTPSLWQSAAQISSIIALGAARFGVSVVPRSVSNIHMDGVIFRPVLGNGPTARITLASRSSGTSAPAASLRAIAGRARMGHAQAWRRG